jgi:Arc/MetJ-type ribon-helix-helix transcriptional regulator
MTIHLPPELERSIEAVVNSGRFASVDDAMAEAARLLLRQESQQPQPAKSAGDTGLGSIGAMRDDADLLDQAVEHAMKVREERPWRLSGVE